jgi:fibro-slime domain-containing protein
VNMRIDSMLTLTRGADGAYSMNSATESPWAELGGFFPLDGLGGGNEDLTDRDGTSHNYLFTSELRYWFEYRGGEELQFSGDDDVFVFVNGTLAVDLGGVHSACYADVVLDSQGHGMSCTTTNVQQGCTPTGDIDFGLVPGNIYEVVLFQAERHTTESNYWLTLTGFTAGSSTCVPVCGDGIQTPDEACDLGRENNTGAHGGCNPDCTLAPYCGDGVVDTEFGEECDDGVNVSLYGGCAPGCVNGPFCGDGQVQTPWEECDDGVNDGSYGKCAPNCEYAPRCGDGKVDLPYEECDEGDMNGEPGIMCDVGCKLKKVK